MKDQLTLFQGDTPASLSLQPGSEKARQMTATSGQRCLIASKNTSHLGSLERMLLATSAWASTMCYLTWKVKATPAGHSLFQLAPSVPRTDATGSGLLPTPAASEHHDYNVNWKSLANLDKGGRIMRSIASAFMPTPTASDNRDRGGPKNPAIRRRLEKGKQINLSMHWDGPLSPLFVEEMMGFPVNWTKID